MTATWKITADPRGTLTIPNAGYEVRIPCGTLQIDAHLEQALDGNDPLDVDLQIPSQWPSQAPGQRYQGVVYIEKEGFGPVLEEARIAERFDVAILSCKGQSVVAARKFVDNVCAQSQGVPLFVVHDFDKAGFEISQRLTQVSDWARNNDRVAYEFTNEIQVVDLGLRLADVEHYGLASEACEFRGQFARDSICTPEEQEYLLSDRRVELNAFTSPQLIEWLETKLSDHGMGKRLIPDDQTVKDAIRRAVVVSKLNLALHEAKVDALKVAIEARISDKLWQELRAAMKEQDQPWDAVLYEMVSKYVKNGGFE